MVAGNKYLLFLSFGKEEKGEYMSYILQDSIAFKFLKKKKNYLLFEMCSDVWLRSARVESPGPSTFMILLQKSLYTRRSIRLQRIIRASFINIFKQQNICWYWFASYTERPDGTYI